MNIWKSHPFPAIRNRNKFGQPLNQICKFQYLSQNSVHYFPENIPTLKSQNFQPIFSLFIYPVPVLILLLFLSSYSQGLHTTDITDTNISFMVKKELLESILCTQVKLCRIYLYAEDTSESSFRTPVRFTWKLPYTFLCL